MNELVIFDVDDTIIKGQGQRLFLNYLYNKKHISLFYYLRLTIWFIMYKIGLIKNPLSAMQYAFSFAKNKTSQDIQIVVNSFFNEVLKNKFYSESEKIIKEHQKNGRKVILLSNAVDVLINKIASYLSVEDFISTKLEIINGLYTGNITGNIIYGKLKIGAVENYVKLKGMSLNNSWAYTDHHSDIPLLLLVTHPYAVNPTKKLELFAKQKEWPIINFQL